VIRSFGEAASFAAEVAATWDENWPEWRETPCGVDVWELS
jgi:hypothetical protein